MLARNTLKGASIGGALGHLLGIGLFYSVAQEPVSGLTGIVSLTGTLNIAASVLTTLLKCNKPADTSDELPISNIAFAAQAPFIPGTIAALVLALISLGFNNESLTLLCMGVGIDGFAIGVGVMSGLLTQTVFRLNANQQSHVQNDNTFIPFV